MDPIPSENPINGTICKIAKVVENTGWHDAQFHIRTVETFSTLDVSVMSQDKMTVYARFAASVSFDQRVSLTVSAPAFNGDAKDAAPFILAFTQVVSLANLLKAVPGVNE